MTDLGYGRLAKQAAPRIFVTLAAPTLAAMEALAGRVVGVPVGYELRLDYLHDFTDFQSQLHQMLVRMHFPQVIATCRREVAGGMMKGTVEEQIAILASAARAGCQWIDVEFETVRKAGSSVLREFRPTKLMVSHHDYRRTPPLSGTYRQLARLPVQAIKVATHARELRDNLKIRRLLKAHRRRAPKLVALAMGPSGIPSRVLGLLWGSALTYASPGNHSGVVPGQVPAEVMRATYRVDRCFSSKSYDPPTPSKPEVIVAKWRSVTLG